MYVGHVLESARCLPFQFENFSCKTSNQDSVGFWKPGHV